MPISIKVPIIYLIVSIVIFLFSSIVISTDKWVRIVVNGKEEYLGLFYSSTNIRDLSCNTNMSFTSCGYLLAAQSSGLLSAIFSACTAVGYYIMASGFQKYPLPGFLWTILGFSESYLTQNDDMNIEYSSAEIISTSEFEWSYWLLAISVIVSGLLSVSNLLFNSERFLLTLRLKPHNPIAWSKLESY